MTVTTYFNIKLESNPSVHLDGYVERHDKNGEDCDWFFYNRNYQAQSQLFIEHDDINGFKDITYKEEAEIDIFKNIYQENIGEISDIILQTDFYDTLNDSYITKKYGLIIEIESVSSGCGFDGHDFYTHSCNECYECGFDNDGW